MFEKIFAQIYANQGRILDYLFIRVRYLQRKAEIYLVEIRYQEIKSKTLREKIFNWLISWTGFTDFCHRRRLLATFNCCQESLQAGVLILLLVQKVSVTNTLTLAELIEQYSRYLPSGLIKRLSQSDFVKTTPSNLSSRSVLEAYLVSKNCHEVIAMQLELFLT